MFLHVPNMQVANGSGDLGQKWTRGMQHASWSGDFVHDRHVARAGGRARLIGALSLLWSRLVRAVQQPRSSAAA